MKREDAWTGVGIVMAKLLIAAVAIALIYFEIRPALDALVGWNEKDAFDTEALPRARRLQ